MSWELRHIEHQQVLGIGEIPDASCAMVVDECPRGRTGYDNVRRILLDRGATYVRWELIEPPYKRCCDRIVPSGLRLVHEIETQDFGLKRKHDRFLIFSKNGVACFRVDPPDCIIHSKVPEGDRICLAERDVETYRDLVLLGTRKGDLVVDLCAGSASLGEACLRTGRRYIGFESCAEMIKKAIVRMGRVEQELTA